MNIKLSLQRHCIETEIKKQYDKAVSDYFKAGKTDGPATELEDRIDMLHQAIENFDFRHLRNQYRDLRGQSDAEVTLCRGASDQLRLFINGETIDAKN